MHLGAAAAGMAAAHLASHHHEARQVGVSGATAPAVSWYSPADIASGAAFHNVSYMAEENMQYNLDQRQIAVSNCTYESAAVRKEW